MRTIVLALCLVITSTGCLAPDELDTDTTAQEVCGPRPHKVRICHRPPGNPGNAHTITVARSAVPAHLAHGDTLGACPSQVCVPGTVDSCYGGPIGTEDVGACVAGTRTCAADGGGYGACVGSVGPSADACGDGLDNDCDGVVDDGCLCAPGTTASCYDGPAGTEGVGTCAAGAQTCAADGLSYGACVGTIGPSADACGDGLDNDCDGAVDDGCVCAPGTTASCYDGPAGTAGVGTCAAGAQTCAADGLSYGACVGTIGPSADTCGDGLDNDCDGAVDDGCVCAPGTTASCYDGPAGTAGVGTCAAGTQTCAADGLSYGACVGAIGPVADVCGDGLDNDCDGAVDDGCIGDRAWFEFAANGIQNPGEPGVGGATFLLRDSAGGVVQVAVSDVFGTYYFSGVPAGTYFVEVIPPPGLFVTVPNAGTNDALDSDFDPDTFTTNPFTFTGGTITDLDCGFFEGGGS